MRRGLGLVAAGTAAVALLAPGLTPRFAAASTAPPSHGGVTATPPQCPAGTHGDTGLEPAEQVLLGPGQARVFAMHHKTVLADAASYTTIYQSLDRELRAQVDPYRAEDRPNIVVFNELNGLTYGVEGTRGALARALAPQLTLIDQKALGEGTSAIGVVAAHYAPQIAYYAAKPGFPLPTTQPQVVERLFASITDTLVRAVVENAACLARAHHAYVAIGTPLPIKEGSACTGQYAGWPACPGWHKSTSLVDVLALQDPDLAPAKSVYVADTPNVDNVQLVFAPDGELYDLQPKVNLTNQEIQLLGWHQAGASTIHAIPLFGADAQNFPQVQMGIGISLDAFENGTSAAPCPAEAGGTTIPNPYPQFMQCLDSKGVTVFLQPEWNAATAACMSWTDFAEQGSTGNGAHPCGAGWSWQPLSWMRSAWLAVQGRKPDGSFTYPHFRYAVNPFIVGHLFDVSGDGQTGIFSRYDTRAVNGWYAGDSSTALYAAASAYTDRADSPEFVSAEGPQPGFLALTRWAVPESAPGAKYRVRTPALRPGDPGSLQSCEHGLAPGSGVTRAKAVAAFGTDACAEDNFHSTALVADLDLSLGPNAGALPATSSGPDVPAWMLLAPVLGAALVLGLGLARRG